MLHVAILGQIFFGSCVNKVKASPGDINSLWENKVSKIFSLHLRLICFQFWHDEITQVQWARKDRVELVDIQLWTERVILLQIAQQFSCLDYEHFEVTLKL